MVPCYFIIETANNAKIHTIMVMERSRAHNIAHRYVNRNSHTLLAHAFVRLSIDRDHTFEHSALRLILN